MHLTGLRCFAAINIVFFHFSNPQWFGFLAPVVNAGFASVSFFILLSGFVLAYNYADRARAGELDKMRFWEARFTRLYPIYLLSLLLSLARRCRRSTRATRHAMFWTGMVLTPLLLQGWIPSIATFLNTPAWTMSAEAFYYLLFPWMAAGRRPARPHASLADGRRVDAGHGARRALHVLQSRRHCAPRPLELRPLAAGAQIYALCHIFSFIFGVMLADLNSMLRTKAASGSGWRWRALPGSMAYWQWGRSCLMPSFTTAC